MWHIKYGQINNTIEYMFPQLDLIISEIHLQFSNQFGAFLKYNWLISSTFNASWNTSITIHYTVRTIWYFLKLTCLFLE